MLVTELGNTSCAADTTLVFEYWVSLKYVHIEVTLSDNISVAGTVTLVDKYCELLK